jgi:hypothetical protein
MAAANIQDETHRRFPELSCAGSEQQSGATKTKDNALNPAMTG